MNILWFVIFSTAEALSVLIMMFCLFRFGLKSYFRDITIASVLFSVISYALRVELNFVDYFPIITIISYAFFAYFIVKAPPFWALIMSIITNTAFFAIQTLLLFVLSAAHLLTLSKVEVYGFHAYMLQSVTAIVQVALSLYLFKKGVGFSFSFDKFRWKSENTIMFIIVCLSFVILLVMFIIKSTFYGAIIGALLLTFLLYLGVRKERSEL